MQLEPEGDDVVVECIQLVDISFGQVLSRDSPYLIADPRDLLSDVLLLEDWEGHVLLQVVGDQLLCQIPVWSEQVSQPKLSIDQGLDRFSKVKCENNKFLLYYCCNYLMSACIIMGT